MSIDIATLEFLTEASVWLGKNNKRSTVLFVTNQSLSARALEKFPSHVVYVDEEGNIFNRTIADFVESRTFYNVDPELETRLKNLVQYSEIGVEALDLEVDDVDGDPDDGAAEPDAEAQAVVAASSAAQDLENNSFMIGYFMDDESKALLLPPPLSSEQLVKATVAYSTDPMVVEGMTAHRFDFKLGGDITLENIAASFYHINAAAAGRAFYSFFGIGALGRTRTLEWTTYVGVFESYTVNGLYGTLILATDGLFDKNADVLAVINSLEGQEGVSALPPAAEVVEALADEANAFPVQTNEDAPAEPEDFDDEEEEDEQPTTAEPVLNTPVSPTDAPLAPAVQTLHVTPQQPAA